MSEIERVALRWWLEHLGGAEAFRALSRPCCRSCGNNTYDPTRFASNEQPRCDECMRKRFRERVVRCPRCGPLGF